MFAITNAFFVGTNAVEEFVQVKTFETYGFMIAAAGLSFLMMALFFGGPRK